MRVDFDIIRWAAWGPGLTTPESWEQWAASPSVPQGADTPPLTEVPAMARRRIEKMGRVAFQVATWVQQEVKGLPLVFASRHGDAPRSVDLLTALARNEPLSPASFAMSVHNAIGGQYSIIRQDTANVIAVSNGLFTPEAGLVEAVTVGTEAVLVVYEASPHPVHAPYYPEAPHDYAYALHVKRGGPWAVCTADVTATPASQLPHALEVLRFFLSRGVHYRAADGVSGYQWSRT
ncbi:MAG: 3-oxoacyl-ACP synthase [Archangium gephyra]|uniref:3-oxoacyl-ACP synthase n=1 Tax=Archangium gephyra TaxID=48 RepID=A0A2W5SZM2_9BACT|nr:MAG: 3-oxoacyl-ACP synthase [Archangium gephyra]